MLKPIALAVILVPLAFATSATADGIPFDSPTSFTTATYDWSGVYVGLSVGGGWGDVDWVFTGGNQPNPNPQHVSDVLGGAHVGIQHQWGNIVLGIEANYIFNHLDGSADCPNVIYNCNASITRTWEVGPRAGFAWDNFLIYATGGYANGAVETATPLKATEVNFDTTKENHDGFYVGGGLDWGITRNIVLGVEYQHVDFQDVEHISSTGNPTQNRRISPDFDVVRARLTLKFDRDEPEPPLPLK
jgi:outer membrane immunogenic protein